jgi:predicted RNase H-like HicB family nuclease
MKYTVVLEREPDGGFVASVPVLPGCVSQGNSREAVDLYVEDCRLAGDPIPQENSVEYVELMTDAR